MTSGRWGKPARPGAAHGPSGGLRRPRQGGTFTDRVMARVAEESTPSPARVFARSLRRLALRDALAALVTAWRLAFEPASSVTASARASAAALFLSVIIIVGVGGAFVTGGAVAYLGSDGPAPGQLAPGASPLVTPAPTPTVTPTPTPAPTATPAPTPRPAPTAEASVTKREDDREDSRKRETPEPKERERETDDEDEGDEDDDD